MAPAGRSTRPLPSFSVSPKMSSASPPTFLKGYGLPEFKSGKFGALGRVIPPVPAEIWSNIEIKLLIL
jgi:hypothetical protein